MTDGRLRTMMTGTHGDTVLVQVPRDAFIRHARNDEGQNARFAQRGADGPQTGNGLQCLRRIFQQRVLISGDAGNSDLEQIINRRTKSNDTRDVRGARLEFFRRVLIEIGRASCRERV